MSDLARKKATNQIIGLKQEDQQWVIDYSIQGGYPGLYPDQLKKKQSNNNGASHDFYDPDFQRRLSEA